MRLFAIVLALALAGPTPAFAQVPEACQSGNWDAAIASCSEWLRDGRLSSQHRAAGLAFKARAQLRKGLLDQALADARLAVEADPESYFAYFVRGSVFVQQGDNAQTLRDFDRSIELLPGYAAAYSYRCVAYLRTDEHDKALADCDRAVSLAPLDAVSHFNRALTHEGLRNYESALTDYGRAIELAPTASVAFSSRGRVHVALGQLERGIEDLDRAIALDARNLFAYAARGNAYALKGDDDRALADFTRAVDLGIFTAAYLGRAEIHLKRNQPDQAMTDLRNILAAPVRSLTDRETRARAESLLKSLEGSMSRAGGKQ